jgi:hypothetical protein
MLKNKKYIADRQAFIEWKRSHTTQKGKFEAECFDDEKEPRSYPCVLLETRFHLLWDKYSLFYSFVYLTDFISDYGG